MKHTIARLVDAALNRFATDVHQRTYHAFTTGMTGADWLTEREADHDVLPPWQRHDDTMPDDLWAAMRRHPAGSRQRPRMAVVPRQPADIGADPGVDGSQPPAGAEATALPPSVADAIASAAGAGGSDIETELKVAIGRVLRECGNRWPTTTAGIVTRDLMHRFEFRHK